MTDKCLFCAIADEQQHAHVVLQTELVTAFLDINPLFVGHTLVVPNSHAQTLMDLPSQSVPPLFGAVQRVSIAVQKALGSDGIFNACNNGVSQSVAHLHVHVVPRNKKDGLRGFMWPRTKYESSEHAETIAASIRNELEDV